MDGSEETLLEAIRKVLSGSSDEVRVGPGDDAAVVAPGSGELVLTTDALVEDVHFSRATITPRELGAKAVVASVSDIAAMAGSPRYALCALTLSDAVDSTWAMELLGGMREACLEHALSLVGGNLARGTEVAVVVTVVGEVAPGRAVTRSGARPGDRLVVTGDLGGSAAGLRLATSRRAADGFSEAERAAIARHLRPTARVGEAGVLARHGASAMIDLSDGLTLDLSRLCDASGVGVRLRVADVPLGPAATIADALGGGEDYELLVTLPGETAVTSARAELREAFGVSLTAIGDIIEGGRVAVEPNGDERALQERGWDHFR